MTAVTARASAALFASAVVAAGVLATPAPTASAATPNLGVCDALSGVAALSPSNVWSVGSSCTRAGGERTLVVHWDGARWSIVRSPNVSVRSSLRRVAALSAANVWAVGSWARTSGGPFRTMAQHWNGATWTVIPTPNVGTGNNTLQDVVALSPRNVWAVGYSSSGALALHYDGVWRVVRTPGDRSFELFGVSAAAPNDIWATGQRVVAGRVTTLAMHWDGRTWRVVTTPNAGAGRNNFLQGGVRVVSTRDVWAVGSYNAGTEVRPAFRTLALHWNGSRWSLVASPNRGNSDLYGGVTSTSGQDVWAVGRGGHTTLVEHWNGRTWSIVASPSPGTRDNQLLSVAALNTTTAFAVGYRANSLTTSATLVLRWNGATWRAM